jgi:hypothetical protein
MHLLGIDHNQHSCFGNYAGMDIEWGFMILVDVLALKNKAIAKGIHVAITSNGAAELL